MQNRASKVHCSESQFPREDLAKPKRPSYMGQIHGQDYYLEYGRSVPKIFVLIFLLFISPPALSSESSFFRCNFSQECGSEIGCRPASMSFDFAINGSTGEATMLGNIGSVSVVPVFGSSAISFVHILDTGAVQTTTIYPNNSAVHSRHTIFLNDPIPSQWHGTCESIT